MARASHLRACQEAARRTRIRDAMCRSGAVVFAVAMILGLLFYMSLQSDTSLKVGDLAPDFSLQDQNNNTVSLRETLSQHRGGLIAFYPKDFTPG